MFMGEFWTNLDRERRLELPPALMQLIPETDRRKGLVAVAGHTLSGSYLRLFPIVAFEPWYDRFLAKVWAKKGTKSVGFAEFDSAGLLWIPEQPAMRAHLTKEVLVLGNADWIEVWDATEYRLASEGGWAIEGPREGRGLWPNPNPSPDGSSYPDSRCQPLP